MTPLLQTGVVQFVIIYDHGGLQIVTYAILQNFISIFHALTVTSTNSILRYTLESVYFTILRKQPVKS